MTWLFRKIDELAKRVIELHPAKFWLAYCIVGFSTVPFFAYDTVQMLSVARISFALLLLIHTTYYIASLHVSIISIVDCPEFTLQKYDVIYLVNVVSVLLAIVVQILYFSGQQGSPVIESQFWVFNLPTVTLFTTYLILCVSAAISLAKATHKGAPEVTFLYSVMSFIYLPIGIPWLKKKHLALEKQL